MPGAMENLKTALDRLTLRQKTQIVMAVVVTVGLIWGISLYATRIRYSVLFTGLGSDDASRVVAALAEQQHWTHGIDADLFARLQNDLVESQAKRLERLFGFDMGHWCMPQRQITYDPAPPPARFALSQSRARGGRP